jgi:hypothetical protein
MVCVTGMRCRKPKYRFSSLAGCLFVTLSVMLSGCQQQPSPSVSGTPVALQTSTAVGETPVPSSREMDDEGLLAITQQYERPVDEADDGFLLVQPLLSGQLPEGFGEDLYEIGVETPDQQALFDQEILPILQESFSKSTFVPPRRLLTGDFGVDYRGIRHLVSLLAQRADQLWVAGEQERAIELAGLPLSLARAMRSRPETASANLFSSAYAESSLSLFPGWLEEAHQQEAIVSSLREALSRNAPGYGHLSETVRVDFAQLLNSLKTEDGRNLLGIGQVEESTLAGWNKQLRAIYLEAQALYDNQSSDAKTFNTSVLSAAQPIQGLVIDYPEVSSMQKHSFVKYKATELGLALLGPDSQSLRALPSAELIKKVFAGDAVTVKALQDMLIVEVDEKSIRVVGQPGKFEMLAPGVEPVFFEFGPTEG